METENLSAYRCPDNPSALGLPTRDGRDEWWPGQQETIDIILNAFLGGKRFVMAAVPTGGGKTIVAAAVQKLLARAGGAGNSLALTHTIQLQHQYTETLEEAEVVTGRANHPCILSRNSPFRIGETPEKPLTAADAPCAIGGKCPEALTPSCPYYVQKDKAEKATMAVMNYAYATRVLQNKKLDPETGVASNPFHRELLVCDECHLAEQGVVSAAEIKLWIGALQRALKGLQLPSLLTNIEVLEGGPRSQKRVRYESTQVWIDWANDTKILMLPKFTEANQGLKSAIAAVKESPRDPRMRDAVIAAKAALKAVTGTYLALVAISKLENPEEWMITREYSSMDRSRVSSITARPLWGWTVADDMLFKYFPRTLLMSATPGDPEMARIKLGIKPEEFEYIERPSPFKPENRPVVFWDVAKLNYSSSDADWDKVARAIGFIATLPAHKYQKGLVHSGSAANARRLVTLINKYLPGRAFTHNFSGGWSFDNDASDDLTREEALEEFKDSPEPRIFVTASFTTGLDLPYLIGWQVIAKVPYGSLGDPTTSRRRAFKLENGFEFGQRNYDAECANTIVQAAGRIVRARDDSGPTFILDGNFKMLKARAYFPKFFLDAYQNFAVQ